MRRTPRDCHGSSSTREEYEQRSGNGKIVYYTDGDISFETQTALSYLQFLMRSEPLEIRFKEDRQYPVQEKCLLSDGDYLTNSTGYVPIGDFSEVVLYSTAQ